MYVNLQRIFICLFIDTCLLLFLNRKLLILKWYLIYRRYTNQEYALRAILEHHGIMMNASGRLYTATGDRSAIT